VTPEIEAHSVADATAPTTVSSRDDGASKRRDGAGLASLIGGYAARTAPLGPRDLTEAGRVRYIATDGSPLCVPRMSPIDGNHYRTFLEQW
jgi:hypothetical protein